MTQTTTNTNQSIPNKRLSVQVSLTGLSFLVTNSGRDEVFHFSETTYPSARTPEELLIDIESFVQKEVENAADYESVSVVYSNAEYALVPSALFDETKASDYLKFNSKILANDYIAWDEIRERGIHVVYVPYVNINNFLFDTFGGFQYYHVATALLNLIPAASRFNEASEAHIFVDKSHFQLVVHRQGELQLCNSYPYTTPEDFIYYILFCFEQLGVNPDSARVVLLGSISEDDPLYEIAYTYIRNLEFMTDDKGRLTIANSLPHEKLLLKSV